MTHLVPVLRPVLGTPFRRGSLYRAAGEVPSFHIAPARTRDARDLITGSVLGSYNSASPAWAVGPDGVLALPAANAPVIEYDPVTLQCLGARIWGAVANLHIYSEDATQWLTPTNVTLAANQGTAPTGALTSDRYLETTTNGLHSQDGSALNFVSGTQYTYSVFVESIGGRNFEIGYPVSLAGASTRFARFNLSTGTIQGTDSGITATITAYPGGRYRCSATVTATASISARIANFINDTSFSRVYAGDTSKGLFIWGAQINTGPLAPYVPTTTTAASSTADVWSITGADFSRIYNQSEGSVYAEIFAASNTSGVAFGAADTFDNTFYSAPDSTFYRSGASLSAQLAAPLSATATTKIATAFRLNDFAAISGNNAISTDTSGAVPISPLRFTIGCAPWSPGNNLLNGYIRELAIFRSRRPNANLQAMTS